MKGSYRTYLYNRGILLTPLHKFIIGQPRILIPIHVPEDFVHTLSDRIELSVPWYGINDLTFSGVSSSTGSLTIWPVILYMDCTIINISSYVIVPSLSISYSWKAPEIIYSIRCCCFGVNRRASYVHLSFSSSRPRLVTLRAQMNSLKSIVPFLFSSNTLKT